MKTTKRLWVLPVLLSIAILLFSFLAGQIQSNGGTVTIRDIQYVNTDGVLQRGLLYIPDTATSQSPAPAVVCCHGYNNTAEMQDLNAIELARRGYVVLAVDSYRQGLSGAPEDESSVIGDGAYAALQYVGTLPFVDKELIGMVGHSKGALGITLAAQAAWTAHEKDPSVITAKAIAPAGVLMLGLDDETPFLTAPVNLCVINADHDEFLGNAVPGLKGIDFNKQPIAKTVFGFTPEYNLYYETGNDSPLDRLQAVEAAAQGSLKVLVEADTTHPGLHFSKNVTARVIDFFDISLRQGTQTLAPDSQIWYWKQIFTGIAMVLFVFLPVAFGRQLLQTNFFRKLTVKQPASYSLIRTPGEKRRYLMLCLLSLIPAPALYLLCMNKLGAFINSVFPLEHVNGFLMLNLVVGGCLLALFFLYFRFIYRKQGGSAENMGVKLSRGQLGRALLLAIILFAICVLFIRVIDFFFKVDFRFWIFSFCRMTPVKWTIFLRYLPSYLFFFLAAGLMYNMSTRVDGVREWKNTLNIAVQSAIGLVIFGIIDYATLYRTGFLASLGAFGSSSSLAPLLLWNLVFILPISAITSRYFFRKTGTIWTGACINALLATLFAVSNTVISTGAL